MLHRASYRMSSESCAKPFSEASRAFSIVSWMAGQLSGAGSAHCTAGRLLAKCCVLPVLPIRVWPRLSHYRIGGGCNGKDHQSDLGDPSHT